MDVSLNEPEERRRGRVRYLLNLNECLKRSLRARWRRWRPEWKPGDGLIQSTEAIRHKPQDEVRIRGEAVCQGGHTANF